MLFFQSHVSSDTGGVMMLEPQPFIANIGDLIFLHNIHSIIKSVLDGTGQDHELVQQVHLGIYKPLEAVLVPVTDLDDDPD